MAVSDPALLTSLGLQANHSTGRTTTISPSAGALLLFQVSGRPFGNNDTFEITSTNVTSTFAGAGAWTEIQGHTDTTGIKHMLVYAQMGASPGSGAIAVTYGGTTCLSSCLAVYEVTGASTSSPIAESTSDIGTSTGPNIRTIADMLADNLLLLSAGIRYTSTNTIVGDADLSTLVYISPGSGVVNAQAIVQYDPNDNQTSGTLSGSTGATNVRYHLILVEIAIASTGAAAISNFNLERVERHYPRGHLRGVMRGALHSVMPAFPSPQGSV